MKPAAPPLDAPPGATRRACLLAGLALACPGGASARPAAVGEAVEWPSLSLLDGSTLPPSAWRQTAAVLVFWSTDCPFCKRHNVHVDKLFRSLAGRPLRVLGVALDRDAHAVRRYMARNGFGFPVTLDADPLRARFTARRVIPMTCLVGRGGHLLQSIAGEMFEEDVLALAGAAGEGG